VAKQQLHGAKTLRPSAADIQTGTVQPNSNVCLVQNSLLIPGALISP